MGLREVRIGAVPSGSDDRGGVVVRVQLVCMIQAGFQHGRRAAVVLRRSKNHDGVGFTSFIADSRVANLTVEIAPVDRNYDQERDGDEGKSFYPLKDANNHATCLRS